MPGLSDSVGRNGVLEQLLLWNVVGQVIAALMDPAFTALQQDALSKHPTMVLTPDVLAKAVVQTFVKQADATSDAAKSGISPTRFDVLLKMAQVRIQPADLAEAVLRTYMDNGAAEQEAQLQGVTPDRFRIMTLLAGDAIGPEQAATALRRGIISKDGAGPDSTSYHQAISESRLHDKWADALYELTQAILSPQAAAEAVVRGFLAHDAGVAAASLSGVDAAQFATMVDLAGDAPSPTQLAEALRRRVIPFDSGNPSQPGFVQGIRQGRLADKWIPMIEALAQQWPTPTDALEARLVGQVDTDTSKQLYQTFGGDPAYWQLLFDTRGEAPTPLELGVLANRGVIPWTGLGAHVVSFDQGFHEGRWRDKWQPVYRALAVYRPPESTVVLFLTHGIITDEEAADELAKLGMDTATIARFIDEAHLEAYSDYRGATVAMVLDAYHEQIITTDQAMQILTDLHVSDKAALIMIELKDMQRAFAAINNVVSRIRTLYAARKITLQTVTDTLGQLGIAPNSILDIVKAWQLENSVSVKILTEAQILKAWKLEILTNDQASTELQNIGYTPFDAWVLMSNEAGGPLQGMPAQGPAAPQGQVIPGTT